MRSSLTAERRWRLPLATLAATMAILVNGGCAPSFDLPDAPGTASTALALAGEVSSERLMTAVREIVAAHRSDTPLDCSRFDASWPPVCHATHLKAREVIRGSLETLGYSVHAHESGEGDFKAVNLIADLPGERAPEEIVLVGAHYDAFYAAANDNSTGVAVVLELARVLRARPWGRTIRFAFFDLEEFGLTGSTRYMADQASGSIAIALILDSVGYTDRRQGSQPSFPGVPQPDTADFLAAVANERSGKRVTELLSLARALSIGNVGGMIAPGDGTAPLLGLTGSDHSPFWLAGIPAVFLTDTGPRRHPHYHSAGDTPELLDPAFLTANARVALAAAAHWAGTP